MTSDADKNDRSFYANALRPFTETLFGLLCISFSTMIQADTEKSESMNTGLHENRQSPCMVILGASYAKSWDIDQLMGCEDILNAGIDGNQSFEMADRFHSDVLAHNPDYVILWGFINDIFRSDSEKLDSTLSRIKTSYRNMVALAREHGIEPILATEVTIREPAGFKNTVLKIVGDLMGKTSYQSFINTQVMRTNDWLRQLAQQENLRLVDLEQALAEDDGRRGKAYTKDDGSHITPAAYLVITDVARRTLNK